MRIYEATKKQVRDRQWSRCARCGKVLMGDEPRELKINEFKDPTSDWLVMLCRECHPIAKNDWGYTHVPHLPARTYHFYYGHR
jgi:hypothetical protein